MRTGVYRKIEGRTGVGQLYEFDCLCRHHTTGLQFVVYIPLRVEPEWAGTVRHCVLERELFERKFEYVSEGLPLLAEAPVGQEAPHQWTTDGKDLNRCTICGDGPWGRHRFQAPLPSQASPNDTK